MEKREDGSEEKREVGREAGSLSGVWLSALSEGEVPRQEANWRHFGSTALTRTIGQAAKPQLKLEWNVCVRVRVCMCVCVRQRESTCTTGDKLKTSALSYSPSLLISLLYSKTGSH